MCLEVINMARIDEDDTRFSVSYNLTAPYLDGVYLAINALPDAFLVYDAHDCGYYKAEKIAGNHDLFSDLLRWDQSHRVMRTNVEMRDYIMGGDDKLSKKLLQVGTRSEPSVIFLARSNPVIVAGHDAKPVVQEISHKVGAPLLMIPDRNIERDFITGYLDVIEQLADHLVLDTAPEPENHVALVGYLFDRNEADNRGNVEELRRMLAAIGARAGAILLDGSPFRDLSLLPVPKLVVDLAGGCGAARRLAARANARAETGYLATGLPVGLEGTATWLSQLAAALGTETLATSFIDRELGPLVEELQWLLPRFLAGRNVVLFADRLLLSPLARLMEELGMTVAGIGCTAVDPRGQVPTDWPWRSVPDDIPGLRAFMEESVQRGDVDLILGNSLIRQIVCDLAVPFVELGYPSCFHHVLYPAPYLGFAGVRVLTERIINAIQATHMA